MNVVIPLGSGSRWQDNELRICLRAVEKNLINYDSIYIVGLLPRWCRNVIHIPFDEQQKGNPDYNIMQKIVLAFEYMSEMFFMNDDHFLLQTFDAEAFPYYYDGKLSESLAKKGLSPYGQRMFNTLEYLATNDLPSLHFDIHTPIIYNRDKFIHRVANLNWEKGFIIKSLYGNYESKNLFKIADCKSTFVPDPLPPIFSTYPHLSSTLQNWLYSMFPNKSKYEI